MRYLYKFLDAGLKSHYDGSEWKIGEWRGVKPPTEECVGLNASKYIQQAIGHVQGSILAKVEVGGKIIKGSDKWTCEKMRIVAVADWTKAESVKLAIFSARSCLERYEKKYPDDDRARKAIEAAEAVLENDNKETRAAASAAWAASAAASAAACAASAASCAAASAAACAASAAACAAASAAARDAAWAAAWAASNAAIHRYCLSIVKWRKA